MKCDRCENEAIVHEVRIESGKRREKHLCDQCARAEGITPQAPAPITALLSQFVTQQSGAAAPVGPAQSPAIKVACPACATTYAQFRANGLLGCPKCYEVFENQITPLIARAHEGGTHHVGKAPKNAAQAQPAGTALATAPSPPPRPVAAKVDERAVIERIAALKKGLAEAIATEKYEQAAKFRDELAQLQGKTTPAPAAAPKRRAKPHGDEGKAGNGGEGHA